jgi:hypothetical protein
MALTYEDQIGSTIIHIFVASNTTTGKDLWKEYQNIKLASSLKHKFRNMIMQ